MYLVKLSEAHTVNLGFGPTVKSSIVCLCKADNCHCIYPYADYITADSICYKGRVLPSEKLCKGWCGYCYIDKDTCEVCGEVKGCISCNSKFHMHNNHSCIKWNYKITELCTICLDRVATRNTSECGNHLSACDLCAEKLTSCPICRRSGKWTNVIVKE